MKRDEFLALPLGMQTAILFDQMPQRMASLPLPRVPLPPKYDGRVSRKGGFCWMREMDLSGLQYFHSRKQQGSKPEYAERDAKDLKSLAYWIEWRITDPQSAWYGERNRQPTRAKPPSRDPEIHAWEKRADSPPSTGQQTGTDEDYFGGGDTEDPKDNGYGF